MTLWKTVSTSDGATLQIEENGNPAGQPLLFLHGFAQCSRIWSRQFESPVLTDRYRLVAWDARGCGHSSVGSAGLGDTRRWADDVAETLDQLGLDDPVLVAWSWGGVIAADYLSAYGSKRVKGLNLVDAGSQLGEKMIPKLGTAFLTDVVAMCNDDPEVHLPAIERFVRRCFASDPSPDDFWRMFGWTARVPPATRFALADRTVDNTEMWRKLPIPVLITHGTADEINLASNVEMHQSLIPQSTVSWYDGIGHAPFIESAERFDHELDEFVTSLSRQRPDTTDSTLSS